MSQGVGRHEKAVEAGQKAIELDPDFSIGYANTAGCAHRGCRLDEPTSVAGHRVTARRESRLYAK
jgi:hypothetical protein